ncbi:electron transfer flavoprotein subunit alpha/FixB family protein [Sulfurospirillum multivorans]|uniref:Electron transfer flavoprotein, alpha subunit n=2 Tax=Sulfurospirillum multivorans TaxID=66821 RepID=A0AA86AR60_SULMK|nr:electron transfer flavoprotein subunit alpha/FixB family protein [Sulfurospirillum multivorans]AHJ14246.1 electron transfer flavoprotein, alpha subunit [Sulfurospirillum multivorans DSM 12446]QEH07731.1 electron transfer flavoprotein, alpha subunit [Sulfurospirillum multivorans]
MSTCIIITDEAPFNGLINIAKPLGEMNAIVVGSKDLAKKVAISGVSSVLFLEACLPEAKANIVAKAVRELSPKIVLTSPTSGARAIAGAIAIALDAVIIQGIINISTENDTVVVEQMALNGRVLDTLTSKNHIVGFFAGEDIELSENSPVAINALDGDGYAMDINISSAGSETSGLAEASRVVSFGRGIKAKEDIALINSFASAIGAEVGCSMPIADDLSWLPKECYIGRSGQTTSPRVYFAIGISGAPQHLEGVRRAKVIVAINNDPEARIFRSADYGIVGDLYEIIPALKKVLNS